MANRHSLSALSRIDLAARMKSNPNHQNLFSLVIISTILSVSLIALSSAATLTGQQQFNQAIRQLQQQKASLSPEYRLIEDLQTQNGAKSQALRQQQQQQQEPPIDYYGIWATNPIAPAKNRDELISQLELARQLLNEQLEADAAALSAAVANGNGNNKHRQQYEISARDQGGDFENLVASNGQQLHYGSADYYLPKQEISKANGLNTRSDQEANLIARQLANELLLRQEENLSPTNSRQLLLPKKPSLSSSFPAQPNGGDDRIIIHLNDNNEREKFNMKLPPQYAEQLRHYQTVDATLQNGAISNNINLEAEKQLLADDKVLDPTISFGTVKTQPNSVTSRPSGDNQPNRVAENKRKSNDVVSGTVIDNNADDENDELDKTENKSSSSLGESDKKTDHHEGKFTTLLEDEQTNNDGINNKEAKEDTTVLKTPLSEPLATVGSTTLAGKSAKRELTIRRTSDEEQKSLLSRVYDKLVSYFSFIIKPTKDNNNESYQVSRNSIITSIGGDQQQQQSTTIGSASGDLVDQNMPPKVAETSGSTGGQFRSKQENSDEDNENKEKTDSAKAKQSVSTMANGSDVSMVGGNLKPEETSNVIVDGAKTSDTTDDNDRRLARTGNTLEKSSSENSKHEIQENEKDDLSNQENLSSPLMGIFDEKIIGNDNQQAKTTRFTRLGTSTNNMKRVHLDSDTGKSSPATVLDEIELGDVLQSPGRHHLVNEQMEPFKKISLIRQSNLVLPLAAADDLLLQAATANHHNNDAGSKYIYAPTQHYYLNSGKLINENDNDEEQANRKAAFFSQYKSNVDELHHQQQQHSASHFQPGSHIFGPSSYESLKPTYAYQQKGSGLEGVLINGGSDSRTLTGANGINNKSNDLYFLVMVGAFCVMAMAVVLAAGLFAYRVQQNRKSSNDLDYPTYGVVGPNNLNGKCGAAAFVGGYLGHHHHHQGPGSTGGSFGSKSNSSKHLPDLYACSDSGIVSTTDKNSSKKASSASTLSDTQSQQQGHVQSAAIRGSQLGSNFIANNQDAARMYHYQHQKQQMIISDRNSAGRHTSASDLDSEDENEDGSYTVYECPGLASAHEMEIKNPLFNDDQSP